jgi:hypothetical protein
MPSGVLLNLDRRSQVSEEKQNSPSKVSPELAWSQIEAQVQQAIEYQYDAAEKLRLEANYPVDFTNLSEVLAETKPSWGVEEMQYANPQFSLESISKQKPLEVLKAVLKMLTQSDHYQAPKQAMQD